MGCASDSRVLMFPQRVLADVRRQKVNHREIGGMIAHQPERVPRLRLDQIMDIGDELVIVADLVLDARRQAIRASSASYGLRKSGG